MRLKTAITLARQRVFERPVIVNALLIPFLIRGRVAALLGNRRRAVTLLSQVHRSTRMAAMRRLVEPYVAANRDVVFPRPVAASGDDISRFFGSRLVVLKAPGPNGERGVLYVMFSELFRLLTAQMDMPRLLADYTLVLEPSWSGYCDEDFLRYTQFEEEVFVLAAERGDYAFLQRLKSNLVPVDLGPCDWVDPAVAAPYVDTEKRFDIVMNANWGKWKRHHVLFRMLRHSKRRYRVALIGMPWSGATLADVEALAAYYGVADQLTFFEKIPFSEVMRITCAAHVSILLSLKEGSNRAIAESIFCDVPVVILKDHVGGIHKNVVAETGAVVREPELESAIARLHDGKLKPRAWGMAHVSCFKSTVRLNALLQQHAVAAGRPWTRDIATRSNSPESRYVDASDGARLQPWNEQLRDYLAVSR